MPDLETYSHNDAESRLADAGILEAIHEIPGIWQDHPGQTNYETRSAALYEVGGFETQVQLDLGPDHRPHDERLTPFLDAYHAEANVGIEHERKEQMRARWHLMKMQAANERDTTLDIDVGVVVFPSGRDPSLRRTRRELEGPFFREHFPIHLPVYAIEYNTD